jgi:hypothetical protein
MSSSLVMPNWIIAYELDAYTDNPDAGGQRTILTQDAGEPGALRLTFEVRQSAISEGWWFADISIYNMNDPSLQRAVTNTQWVRLKAGFQQSKAQIIWDGPVFQTTIDRENVVDYNVTFHCIVGLGVLTAGMVNFTQGAYATQAQTVLRMVAETEAMSGQQVTLQSPMPSQLTAKQYPMAKTFFGTPDKYFGQVAADNNLSRWLGSGNGLNMGSLNPAGAAPDFTFSSPIPPGSTVGAKPGVSYTLAGSPQQTATGVNWRVLLNPALKPQFPPILCKLDNTIIRQLTLNLPQGATLPLDSDGLYVVAQVTHRGDTRGELWETEVVGYSLQYTTDLPMGIFGGDSNGGNP